MTAFFAKWLPIVFGCHCRADRSFFYRGRQFPICARCTGELVGILVFIITSFTYIPPFWIACGLMLPLIADGFIQALTKYESTNPRRFFTGLLFGYGFAAILTIPLIHAFRSGYDWARSRQF